MSENNGSQAPRAEKAREPLGTTRMVDAEYERHQWVVTPEAGTTIEQILKPAYWASVAVKLRAWDRIEVRAEDGSFYAELLVLSSDRTWAKMALLTQHELIPADVMSQVSPAGSEEYAVKFRGPHLKHSIIRLKDGAVIKEGMGKEEAFRALAEHVRVVSR